MPARHPGPRTGKPMAEREAGAGWQGRMRLWLAIDGHNALGPGKVRLLEAIAAERSLTAAAKRLRMSYRLAWQHVRHIEERTGLTVVEPHRGGRSGGGTDLTLDGRALLNTYHRFREEVEECMQTACTRCFAAWSLVPRVADSNESQGDEPSP